MDLGNQYLQRRGGTYVFRRRIPDDLQAILGRTEFKESLRTKDHGEARQRRNRLAVHTDELLASARKRLEGSASPPLTPEDTRALAQGWLRDALQFDEAMRLASGEQWSDNVDTALDHSAAEDREDLAHLNWQAMAVEAEELLAKAGRWYPAGDESVRLVAAELLKARVKLNGLLDERQRGEVVEPPPPAPTLVRPSPTVSELIDAYRKDREARYGAESTSRKFDHIFAALKEVLGADRRVSEVSRADCREVRDLLQRVPAHASKRYPGLTLREAAAAAEKDGSPTLAPGTVATYLQNLSAVFEWAVEDGLLDRNPASGLGGGGRPQVKRRGYTAEELSVIFPALLRFRESRPSRYWVPAIALYSGARAGELCQLLVSDVREEGGRLFLSLSPYDEDGVRSGSKRLKTAASERVIPVHSDVINAGFREFVEARRAAGAERLFPDVREGPNGGFSHDLSKFWGRFRASLGLGGRATVLHSFRHGFADAARRGGIPSETADAIGWWASRGQRARYGDRLAMSQEIEKVRYGSFRLPRSI